MWPGVQGDEWLTFELPTVDVLWRALIRKASRIFYRFDRHAARKTRTAMEANDEQEPMDCDSTPSGVDLKYVEVCVSLVPRLSLIHI